MDKTIAAKCEKQISISLIFRRHLLFFSGLTKALTFTQVFETLNWVNKNEER